MMNGYDLLMTPLERGLLSAMRRHLLTHAAGDVLEIGYGTGANFPHYPMDRLNSLTALDLDSHDRARALGEHWVRFVLGRSEQLPFEDNAMDTVVETLVLCSVTDVEQSLREIHRVLRPGGLFLYIDHVLPEQPVLSAAFLQANRLWPRIAHGCNLNRRPHDGLEALGFSVLESGSGGKGIFRWGVAMRG